jgi:transcription initiation factor TFIIB
MLRLKKWRIRSNIYNLSDKKLNYAIFKLHQISKKLCIPSHVEERAEAIYRRALVKGLNRGRLTTIVIAAAIYAACRESGITRNLREIATISLTNKKNVARCYRLLFQELRLQIPIQDPIIWVPKIAEKIKVSNKTQTFALQILQEAKKRGVSMGKDPLGLAAAALFIACLKNNEATTQKAIAIAAGVTEVTVRNRYKSLMKELELNFSLPWKGEIYKQDRII